MKKPIIEVKHLSKRYRLGYIGLGSLVDDLKLLCKKIGLPCSSIDPESQFLALDDISFTVTKGEVLGIIGGNGAGKSTLLKILSRITEPTHGEVILRGRVKALLEVGTGFNGELTGKENIYLNGALHGLTREEVSCKFDEIVNFSQIGEFLDTPVKRYSSGMFVRLAFAVAINLDPEILILDEVLAVGDASFQRKCLEKVEDLKKRGNTILFVSHNMGSISSICDRVIVIKEGSISFNGNVNEGISKYLKTESAREGFVLFNDSTGNRNGSQVYSKLLEMRTLDKENKVISSIKMGSFLRIEISLEILRQISNFEIGFNFTNEQGTRYGAFLNSWEGARTSFNKGRYSFSISIPYVYLMPNIYYLNVWTREIGKEIDDTVVRALELEVIDDDFTGNRSYFSSYKFMGVFQRSFWSEITPE